MIFVRDSRRVGYTAAAFDFTEFLADLLVFRFFFGELPEGNTVFHIYDSAFCAGNFKSPELSRMRGRCTVDNS